jgi:hypothetical protein
MKYSSMAFKSNWLGKANVVSCMSLLVIGIYVGSAEASVKYVEKYDAAFFRMANNTPSPRAEKIGLCVVAPGRDCTVFIHSSAGIHFNRSDPLEHLTVRFEGPDRPYDTCHIYLEEDDHGNNKSKCFHD